MGRLIEVRDASGTLMQKNVYDKDSLLTAVYDATGKAIEYTYDIGGRTTSITTPKAQEAGKVSQEYTYDAQGNVTSETDGEGNTTLYVNDMWGNTTKATDPDGIITQYAYDKLGNITYVTDGRGNTTTYTYNTLNSLSAVTDAQGLTIQYRYDREGRLTRETDRNGTILNYSYNSDGNITEKQVQGSAEYEQFLYNRDGSQLAAINDNSVETYTYTPNGNVKSVARNGKTLLEYLTDKNGMITKITDSEGDITGYTYDTAGRLKTVTDNAAVAATYNYNADSTIASINYGTGIKEVYGYDSDKNIITLTNKKADGSILDDYSYTYDNNGNQLTKTENGITTTYAYDKLNRLTKENNTTYTYDNAGNRLTKTDGTSTTTYAYDLINRLIQETKDGILTTYSYDKNGNLTAESDGTQYSYDSFNQLVETNKSDGTWQQNVYDATGLRMATVENGTYTEYTYDRDSILADYDKNGQMKTRYVRGNDLIAQKDKKGTTSYYLHNAHGDVTKLVDSTGKVLNSYSYDAFGNTTSYTEQVENRFRYAGEQYDTVTGQIYLRARYYDPSIGRFTQEDPYRGDGLNLYTYVSNNPVKYIDPTGLAKCTAAKNFDKALDGLQTVLDIAGFVPGIGDVLDAVNLGISIFRGQVLDAVFSSIALIPGLGSAIAAPLKTIFHAVGDVTGITKAVNTLGILFGGTSKIVTKLDGMSKSIKTLANKIPDLIASLKNNFVAKSLIGKKKLNTIVSGVRSGISSLISRANDVMSAVKKSVKKVVKKDINETAKITPKTNPVGGGCFTAGTLVPTEDGQRTIKDVKVGDYVWSENPETGEVGLKKVVKTFIHEKYILIHVYAVDTMIETTEEHPFWVEGKGWVFAGELNEGDVLRLKSGENVKVTKLERVHLKEPVKVYNFEVEDWHTYFVSDINVLVHNKAMKYTPPAITAGKNFKNHFINHKKILEDALGTKYSKFKTDGSRFLEDIGKIIDDGTVEFVGEGSLKKGTEVFDIYRGNGMTVVIKPSGEFVTLLEMGKGMDLGIQFVK